MCGICGAFDFRGAPISRETIEKMTRALRHRGPDGEGLVVEDSVGLGHRRLSIIDLAGGSQPMSNENDRIHIVFNGEIYNFLELRTELIKKGHIFKTESDTEVIVHAYEEWGTSCLRYFNGIFAFALWDGQHRKLFIARDHLGVKPLYYVVVGNLLLFASEIKSLLTVRECPREVEIKSLGKLFTLRYVPSPDTLFKHIKKLSPGHLMEVTERGVAIARYWTWKPTIREETDVRALKQEYLTLVEDAVRLQMRSDVPVGLFLSGGMDSAALLAIMRKYGGGPISTFTIGFEGGTETNETDDARRIADQFGSEHTEMMIGPEDYRQYYERYLWDIEEPVGNETAAAFYFVSSIASKKVKVALTGQGADEPWAGYSRHLGIKLSEYYCRAPRFVTQSVVRPLVERLAKHETLRRGVAALDEPDIFRRLIKTYSFYNSRMKARLFKPEILGQCSPDGEDAREALWPLMREVEHLDALNQMLYIDTRANLPDDLLMVNDKTSMANSLEARVPYLDYRIVEFIETLPSDLKLHGVTAKYLHKEALSEVLPTKVVYQKKKGFANPIGQWLRASLAGYVGECLLSSSSATRQYFEPEYIKTLVADHESGKQNYLRHIYLLVSFELWYRAFMLR